MVAKILREVEKIGSMLVIHDGNVHVQGKVNSLLSTELILSHGQQQLNCHHLKRIT